MPIWNQSQDLSLVDGQAAVWWLDLASPFGDTPHGIDWTIEFPEGLTICDVTQRPHFGVGPDAHRPHIAHDNGALHMSFPGYLPGEQRRRPMTHHTTWCELYYPLVVTADEAVDGSEVIIHRRALGDHDTRRLPLTILSDPGLQPPPRQRRNVQADFLPWFSRAEQEALAIVLRRCGITDVNLNWHTFGIPLLPATVYAESIAILRREMPGVRIWIGGMPGADCALPRAEGIYQRDIPFVANPQVATTVGRDLVIANESHWCQITGADGVMITCFEPVLVDDDPWPPHCFSYANRQQFADEIGLRSVPDPIAIRMRHPDHWLDFCSRQMARLIALARHGHRDLPLALCQIGRHTPVSSAASHGWQSLGAMADISIFIHHTEDGSDHAQERWGLTRLGGLPQAWWEHGNDSLGSITDPSLLVPDMKMQTALSGGAGVRLWNWARCHGRHQQALMEWR